MTSVADKTVLVTGSNSGIGFEAAAQLAEAGWGNVILACRTEEKAEAARKLLVDRTGRDPFKVLAIDTSEVDSATAASDKLLEDDIHVDFLLLNAGATGSIPIFNSDGVEITWASNLVGHHVLAMRLLGDGLLTSSARIVIAGSEGSRGTVPGMKVHDIEAVANDHHDGDRVAAIEAVAKIKGPYKFNSNSEYVSSKMVVAWWAAALSRRLPVGMTVNAVSPGSVMGTRFTRNASLMVRLVMVPAMKFLGPFMGMAGSIENAAARYVAAADLGDVETGHFYATAHRRKLVGPTAIQTWPEYFTDETSQEAAFQAVVNLTKVPFPDTASTKTPA